MSLPVRRVALIRYVPLALALLLVSSVPASLSAQSVFAPTSTFGPFVQQAQLPITGTTRIFGDTAVVAALGVVHVFERDPISDGWTETAQLTPIDGAVGFAERGIAVHGDTIIVGAEGAAYLFQRARRTGTWRQVQKLVPGDGNADLGWAVDVDRTHAIVGGDGSRVYVFRRNAGATPRWHDVATLEFAEAGYFGWAVGISEGAAIVGGTRGPRPRAFIFGQDAGGPENWGLLRDHTAFFDFGSGLAIDGDVAMVSTNDPGWSGAFINVFRRDAGGTDAWGREPSYVVHDRGATSGLSLSGDRVADLSFIGARISARNQGYLAPPQWNPIVGGPNAWGEVALLRLIGPQRPTSTAISGDTVLVAIPNRHVEVLVSDIDGDGIRDGRDSCLRDPLNNVAGGCRRASYAYPMLDDLITQDTLTSDTAGGRVIVTATFTNTSDTAVKYPFFEVVTLTTPHVVLNGDGGRGGVGSTFSPDVGDGVLSPRESMEVRFVIRARSPKPFEFRVVFRGEPVW